MILLSVVLQLLLANDIPKLRSKLAVTPPDQLMQIQAQIQSSYAMAEIFYQTLNVITIKQSPMFDVSILKYLVATVVINELSVATVVGCTAWSCSTRDRNLHHITTRYDTMSICL